MTRKADLPEKQETFKLNEVCKHANVQPYMLRFWGTEFPQLEAQKSGTGQRLYSRHQVELILEIRRLLFDEGMTIAGARKRINALPEGARAGDAEPAPKAKKAKPRKKPAAPAPKAVEEPAPAPPPEVDKPGPNRVQPLLATLKHVRGEVARILDELKAEQ